MAVRAGLAAVVVAVATRTTGARCTAAGRRAANRGAAASRDTSTGSTSGPRGRCRPVLVAATSNRRRSEDQDPEQPRFRRPQDKGLGHVYG